MATKRSEPTSTRAQNGAARAQYHALPPLPSTVGTVLGPIAVELVDGSPLPDDPDGLGCCDLQQRRITIRRGLPPVVAWQVLFHELVHLALSDAGVRLTPDQEESVCDAVGTARAAELLAASRRR